MLLKNSTLNYDFLKRNQKSMRTVLDRMATKKRKSLILEESLRLESDVA